MKLLIQLTSVLFLLMLSMSEGFAGDAEITLKHPTAVSSQRVAPAALPSRSRSSMDMQRMLRTLKPVMTRAMTKPSGQMSVSAKPAEPPKYEVTDCTGSDGVDMACCGWTPGSGGSSCDMFLALCEQNGWSGTGNSNGAACKGEGTVE